MPIWIQGSRSPSLFTPASLHGIERIDNGQVLASTDGDRPDTLSVFMCGPAGMTRKFGAEFPRVGIPRGHIYCEYFDWR